MKKILFVCLHRPDRSPSQRFRFEQYLRILEEDGWNCTFSFLLDEKMDKDFYTSKNYINKAYILLSSTTKRFKEIRSSSFDIVYIQRECFILGTSWFERQFARRNKIIFDFDDAIWMDQKGINRSANKNLSFLKNPSKTKEIIKVANLVIAGNKYLQEYALQYNHNVKIIPTTIDTQIYQKINMPEQNGRICIGWSGSFSTIIHFEHVIPALKLISKKYKDRVYFKVIGDAKYQNEELNIIGLPWIKETEIEDLSEIDIGLMPLPDDEWAKGKCGLKGLQYMALEIPTIMSPVGVNIEIIEHGYNGLLAETMEDWANSISFLIENSSDLMRIGRQGRVTVQKEYSVEANKHKYIDYFNEVLNQKSPS